MKKPHRCWIVALLFSVEISNIAAPPEIQYQPRNRTVILWQPAAFGVIAEGAPTLHYRWRKNGVLVPGATNDQFFINRSDFSDAGSYSVEVANDAGIATSTSAELVVNSPRTGDIDFSFPTGGRINNVIRSFAFQSDEKTIIAGDFTTVHGAVRGHVARLNADGRTDLLFLDGLSGADSPVYAAGIQGDGKILVAGAFKRFNDLALTNLARLNQDGTVDRSFEMIPAYTNGRINTLVVQSDDKVMIGGAYTESITVCDPTYGYCYSYDADRPLVSRLNSNGTPDSSFRPSFLRTNGLINAVAIQDDGKVLVGGEFALSIGPPHNGLTRLNRDGTRDFTFQVGVTGVVYAVAIQSDGKILVGGAFTNVFGTARHLLVRLNSAGTLDSSFQSPISTSDGVVQSISLPGNGAILIGGSFRIGSRYGIARLRADGTPDDTFQDSLLPAASRQVYAVASDGDGRVYACGNLPRINSDGLPVANLQLTRFENNGGFDQTFDNGTSGANGTVKALAIRPNGKVVLGGYFNEVNGIPRTGVAELDRNGKIDIGVVYSALPSVFAVALQPDGKVLAGTPFGGIVRCHLDGERDTSFYGAVNDVRGIALQADGKVVVGGHFALYNRNNCDQWSIGRLLANGDRDTTFLRGQCGAGSGSVVNAVAVQDDGRILYGGSYVVPYAYVLHRGPLTRVHPDGALDTNFFAIFDPKPGSYGVMSIVQQSDGRILLGGDFWARSSDYSRFALNMARLNVDGTMDTSFLNGASADSWVTAVQCQQDGRILIGGIFTNVNGSARQAIARLHPDGTLDNAFRSGQSAIRTASSTFAVWSMARQDDGNIIIGGGIESVDGVPMSNLCRIWGTDFVPPRIQSISLEEGNVCLAWDAMPHRNYRVQYKENLASDAWVDLAGDIVASSNIASKTDASLGSVSQRFYRITLPLEP